MRMEWIAIARPPRSRPLRHSRLQPARAAAQSRARGLERHRRAAAAAHRSRPQPGRDREGLCGARARRVRGGDAKRAHRASPPTASPARPPAERALQGSLGRLLAVAEAYPQLKADKNFLELQEQLAEIEDQLQMARRYYNGAVRNLNISDPVVSRASWSRGRSVSRGAVLRARDRAEAAAPQIAFPGGKP